MVGSVDRGGMGMGGYVKEGEGGQHNRMGCGYAGESGERAVMQVQDRLMDEIPIAFRGEVFEEFEVLELPEK